MLSGILVVVFCSLGYLLSYTGYQKGKDHYALFGLFLCGLALRCFCAGDTFLHSWDERYHALVAKHLLLHFLEPTLYEHTVLPFDYRVWSVAHIWLHKQPMALWLIALSLKLFGFVPFAVRVPSVILSSICILLVFDVANFYYGRRVAFVASFLCSINGMLIELATGRAATDHVDAIFVFFTLLCFWLSLKYLQSHKKYLVALVGLAMGLAMLTKWLPGLFMLLLFVIACWGKDSVKRIILNVAVILMVALIVFLPWQIYTYLAFPVEAIWETAFNRRHLWEAIEGHSGTFFYHFEMLRINYGDLVYLPVIYFSYITWTKRRLEDLLFMVWFWVPFLFYTLAATKMAAYTAIAAPAIFIIIGRTVIDWIDNSSMVLWRKQALRLIALLLWLMPARFCVERVKPFADQTSDIEWNRRLDEFVAENHPDAKTVVVNCSHPTELMFKCDCICYENLPDQAILDDLKKNYRVFVMQR